MTDESAPNDRPSGGEAPPSPAPRRPAWKRALGWSLKLAALGLSAWLAWRVLRGLQWSQLRGLLATADRVWLAAVAGLLAARPAVTAVRWRLALRTIGRPPGRWWTFQAMAASLLVDHITPTARLLSSGFRARWLVRDTRHEAGPAFGTVLYEQLTHEVLMALATILGVVLVPVLLGRWGLAAGLALAGGLFVVGVFLWARRHGGGLADAAAGFFSRRVGQGEEGQREEEQGEGEPGEDEGSRGRVERFFLHSRETVETGRRLVADLPLGARCLALGAGFLALNVLAQWAAFRALGVTPGLVTVLAVITVGLTAGVLAGTPGGAGATEAVMVWVYVQLGVEAADAAAGALLYRGAHYAVVVILGLPALGFLELRN